MSKRMLKMILPITLVIATLSGCALGPSDDDNDTYTITWKNYDGAILEIDQNVEEGTIPTYDGMTPSREKDTQYTYTFNGWSPEVVAASSDATYTAQYATALRTYTVTWATEDGDILEVDEDVPYGTMPTYDGQTVFQNQYDWIDYEIKGWSPAVSEVTGDITYVAIFGTLSDGPIITISSPASHREWLRARLLDFNEEREANGEVKVNFRFEERDVINIANQITNWATGPNIYAYYSTNVQPLYSTGALAPVPDEYVTQLEDQLSSGALEAATFVNDIYAYPYTGNDGYFLMYNSDYVTDEQASDIYSLVDAAKAAGKKIVYPIKEAFYGAGALFTFGADYEIEFTPSGTIDYVNATFDTDAGFKTAKAFVDLLKYAGDTIITDINYQTAPDGETLVAVVDGSWNAASYTETVGDSLKMSKLPTITYNKGQVDEEVTTLSSFLGYELYGVNPQANGGDAEIVQLSHEIAMYLTSQDVQENRFDELETVPTNKNVMMLDKVMNDALANALISQSQYAKPQTAVPAYLWSAPVTFWYQICDNYEIITDEQIREALTTLNIAVEMSR